MSGLYTYRAPPALNAMDLALMASSPRQSTSAPANVCCGVLPKAIVFGTQVGVFAVVTSSTPSFEKAIAMQVVKIIDLINQIMSAPASTNFQHVPSMQQAIINLNNEAIKYHDYKVQSINRVTTNALRQFNAFNCSPAKRACGVGKWLENDAFCTMVCQYMEQFVAEIAVFMGWLGQYGEVDMDLIRQIARN